MARSSRRSEDGSALELVDSARSDDRPESPARPAGFEPATFRSGDDTPEAVTAAENGRDVILVRPFTEADDVAGSHAANGILTSEGGKVSQARSWHAGWAAPRHRRRRPGNRPSRLARCTSMAAFYARAT